MTKLLAAVDNSTAALAVVGTACAVADLFGAKVEVLHVVENGDDVARAAADAALVPYGTAAGDPIAELLAAAEDPDVLGIAVAARRLDRVGGPALGGTTRAMLTRLRKPVVVVPPGDDAPARIDRVLVPLDGEPATTDALRGTLQPLAASDVEIIVLHVCAPESIPRFADQVQHETESWAREFLLRYWPVPSRRVRLELRVGEPDGEVAGTVNRLAADLIVLGWGRSLAAGRAQVARRLLEQDRVPILLVAGGSRSC